MLLKENLFFWFRKPVITKSNMEEYAVKDPQFRVTPKSQPVDREVQPKITTISHGNSVLSDGLYKVCVNQKNQVSSRKPISGTKAVLLEAAPRPPLTVR